MAASIIHARLPIRLAISVLAYCLLSPNDRNTVTTFITGFSNSRIQGRYLVVWNPGRYSTLVSENNNCSNNSNIDTNTTINNNNNNNDSSITYINNNNNNNSSNCNNNSSSEIPVRKPTISSEDNRREIKHIVGKMCGLVRLCNTSGMNMSLYNTAQSQPCSPCDRCSCDRDTCQLLGDCCVDLVIDDAITPSNERRSHGDCFDTRISGLPKTPRNQRVPRQRMVSSCPTSFADLDLVIRCEAGSLLSSKVTAERLSNYWPVGDRLTNVTFRNRACALCHGVDMEWTQPWNLKIECWPHETASTRGLSQIQILQIFLEDDKCQVRFELPTSGISSRPCHDVIFHKGDQEIAGVCNITGQRMNFDPVLWRSCERFGSIFYSRPPLFTQRGPVNYFANAFCRLCQKDGEVETIPNCVRTRPFSFYFLLTLDSLEGGGGGAEGASGKAASCACQKFEIWDPYTAKCREIMCPQGYDISFDIDDGTSGDFRCMDDGTKSSGTVYRLSIELAPLEDDATLGTGDVIAIDLDILTAICNVLGTSIFNELNKKFNKKFVFASTYCYCHLQVGLEPQTPACQHIPFTMFLTTDVDNTKAVHTAHFVSSVMELTHSTIDVLFAVNNTPNAMKLKASVSPGINVTVIDNMSAGAVPGFLDHTGVHGSIMIVDLKKDDAKFRTYNIEKVTNTLTCPYLVVDEALGSDVTIVEARQNETSHEIASVPSKLVYNKTHGLVLNFTEFIQTREGKIVVCAEKFVNLWRVSALNEMTSDESEEFDYTDGLYLSSTICLSFSCVCFLLTLMTYCLFPSLRTLPGLNTMSLVITMLITMMLVLTSIVFDTDTELCQVVGVVTHFTLLSSVTWMVICTLHTHRIFTNILHHAKRSDNSSKLYLKYLVVSLVVPAIIISATIAANYFYANTNEGNGDGTSNLLNTRSSDINATSVPPQDATYQDNITTTTISTTTGFSDNDVTLSNKDKDERSCVVTSSSSLTPIGYGEGVCYISNPISVLLAAGLPILLANVFNAVVFGLTLAAMRNMTSDQKLVRKDSRRQLMIYLKLSALTGLNWLPGLLSSFINSSATFYAFNILAGLQGVFVLAAFVLNARVMTLYKVKFRGPESGSRPVTTTTTG